MLDASEYTYIAYISYRHSPLDMKAAKQVQKKIENYKIPKEFQEHFGGKRFGRVFRDQDELPSTASLSDSIRDAIDRSKFLVVICTPELPKSKWCEEEIRYFLETHDRSRLLAVLVDGKPEQSFSPYMLYDFDEEGKPIADYEPLAVNIDGPNHTINSQVFNKEITRLYATFLGCPFDSLWQREKRARLKRLLGASAVTIAILGIFLGVVLNRNARIREQNIKIEDQNRKLQSRLSTSLVDSGISKLEDYDVQGALTDALSSMESGDPDVYDHRVGELLSDALCAYKIDELRSSIVYSQSTGIEKIQVTDDKEHMILVDEVGVVRCLDLSDYSVLWERPMGRGIPEVYVKNLKNKIICRSSYGLYCFSISDGTEIWSVPQIEENGNAFQAVSDDGSIFAVIVQDNTRRKTDLVFINTDDGSERGRVDALANGDYTLYSDSWVSAFSYAGAFSEDNDRFAYVVPVVKNDDQIREYHLGYIDMDSFEKQMIAAVNAQDYLFYGLDVNSVDDSVFLAIYTRFSVETILCKKNGEDFDITANEVAHKIASGGGVDFVDDYFGTSDCRFLSKQGRIFILSDNQLFVYNRADNELYNFYSLHGTIVNAYWSDINRDVLEIVTDDGFISDYQMSFDDGRVMSNIKGVQADQDRVSRVCTSGNGSMSEYGSIYTISENAPGKLFYTGYASDPNGNTVYEEKKNEGDRYVNGYIVPEHNDAGFLFFNDNTVVSFDKRNGKILKTAHFEDNLDANSALILDDGQILKGNVRYSMDGTSEAYATPVNYGLSDTYPFYSIRLYDGRILSWNDSSLYGYERDKSQINDSTSDNGHPQIISVWMDGSSVKGLNDVENQVCFFEDYNNLTPLTVVGENGLILRYGYVADLLSDTFTVRDKKELYFIDVPSEKVIRMEDPFPSFGNFKTAMAHTKDLCAAAYQDGTICVFDIEKESVDSLENKYDADEIMNLCFSDNDLYLLVLTSTGKLDIYETDTFEIKFSKLIDRFMLGTQTLSTFELMAQSSKDNGTIFVSISDNCLIIDTSGWNEIVDFSGYSVSFDKDSEKVYFKIYNYEPDSADGTKIVAYPLYDIPVLKEWAEKEAGREKDIK